LSPRRGTDGIDTSFKQDLVKSDVLPLEGILVPRAPSLWPSAYLHSSSTAPARLGAGEFRGVKASRLPPSGFALYSGSWGVRYPRSKIPRRQCYTRVADMRIKKPRPGNSRPGLPERAAIERVYRRAVEDEKRVLEMWPRAREHKKKRVDELRFSPFAEKMMSSDQHGAGTHKKVVEGVREAHMKAIKGLMPALVNYRPSELVVASLHEAWFLYAELLLAGAAAMRGADFADLRPQLEHCGFDAQILSFFRSNQKRKYFLQQTPSSIATFIVSQRLPERICSEETMRTAQKRLYSKVRAWRRNR
jgi:hypothetical protein